MITYEKILGLRKIILPSSTATKIFTLDAGSFVVHENRASPDLSNYSKTLQIEGRENDGTYLKCESWISCINFGLAPSLRRSWLSVVNQWVAAENTIYHVIISVCPVCTDHISRQLGYPPYPQDIRAFFPHLKHLPWADLPSAVWVAWAPTLLEKGDGWIDSS